MDLLRPSIGFEQPKSGKIEAADLSVRFRGLSALSAVDFTLNRTEIVGLIGPNGAGKTTLVNCLTGFQRPSAGTICVGGEDTYGWKPATFRKVGVARTFQSGRLFNHATVIENVEVTAVALGLRRAAAHRCSMEMLDWLGIADKAETIAGVLPYTDQRRVGIARALMLAPAFVLLDEPAAGMSDAECDALMGFIHQIPKLFSSGVLLIEHNMRVVMGVCDRIHVLDGGRTIARGTPREIQSNLAVISAYLGEV